MDTTSIITPGSSAKLVAANKILLVEDNPGDARLVEIYLIDSDLKDHPIVHVTTLGEALEFIGEESDLAGIILDLSLPDSNGFETLETLLSHFPYQNVIVLTGLTDKNVGLKAVQAGAQDYLVKGEFDQEQLSKSLRFSIERARILKRLEQTQQIAQIGNWEYYPDTKFFLASDEMYMAYGCKPRLLQRQPTDELDNDCVYKMLLGVHELAAIYGEYKDDIMIERNDGKIRYAYVECRFQENPNGKVFFQGIFQDITERKLSEQEVAKSKKRYQEVFTQSKDAIFICNIDGKIVDFNQATVELFGYSRKELQELLNIHLLYHTPERKNELLLKLKLQGDVKDFDIGVIRRDGDFRECVLSATLSSTDGENIYSCIVRDITEQIQAEKLRKAKEIAEQSSKMKEQFVASISHEMRTPMNAIYGMSNLLLQTDMTGEQNELVDSIKKSSEVLLGVVNDILEISSIQNSTIVFENKAFDLHDLLRDVVNVMQYKANEKDISIEVSTDEDIPKFVKGDSLRLNQVLYNLVGNGIKFTDRGSVKIIVKKLYDILDSVQLQFTIEDTGIGIPEDKIESMFETFTRIRAKDRVYEGTGLGLSICKNLVEMQGGKISATSVLGEGSKFSFDLLFESAQGLDIKPALTELEISNFHDLRHFKLLLVEDHKMNQVVAVKTLQKKWEFAEIIVAENGQEALELLKKQNFDIILMDIQMPVMDGYEATNCIRRDFPPEKAKVPILAMTAHAHISKDQKFMKIGMDDFVLKPFDPEELYNKVAKYVNKHKNEK